MVRAAKAEKKFPGRSRSTKVRKRTTVYLSSSVHKAAKVRAAQGGQQLSEVVELALVKLLKLSPKVEM